MVLSLGGVTAWTQNCADQQTLDFIDSRYQKVESLSSLLWGYSEVGYQEVKSTAVLQKALADEGFEIESGVAGIPTAFVASYGEGQPIIAILAEMDALPGINQDAVPTRQLVEDKDAGQACGHHLFGAGSTEAAIAVKHWLQRTGNKGTIRLYGTPAEEGGSGKVYMVRAGLFDDVDVALHWHPSDRKTAATETTLANRSAKFRFHGVSAHAAFAPEKAQTISRKRFFLIQVSKYRLDHYRVFNAGKSLPREWSKCFGYDLDITARNF